jgi:MFS family permease
LTGSDAIMVLFAQERLGLGSVGFGLLLTGSAVGGVAGSVVAPRLSRRLGPVAVMTGGFIVAGFAAIGIGLARSPWVAGGLLTLSGLVVVTFNVIMGSLRQQLIPDRLLGRVISAFRLFSYGSMPLGALFGARLPAGSVCRRRSLWSVWRFRSWHCSPCRSSTGAPSTSPCGGGARGCGPSGDGQR